MSVRPVVIGLVGGIGAGKSFVAGVFESLGGVVYNADHETAKVLADETVVEQLRAWWGDGVVRADGHVDRSAVAKIVFSDEEQRLRLEALIHPRLASARAQAINDATRNGASCVVIDAPLLFEAGIEDECDRVVFVDAPRDVRLERVRSRGWDDAELARRESSQWPIEQKKKRSDAVILNHGDSDALIRSCRDLLEEFSESLGSGPFDSDEKS